MSSSKASIDNHHHLINFFFMLISAAMLIPFILVISISITDERSLMEYGYLLIPKEISFEAYKLILTSPAQLLRAYGVTVFVTVVGTTFGLILTCLIAYAMSRKDYRYRRATTLYVLVTMLFTPGLVPVYIVVTQYLHLKDTIWALIAPYLLSPFFVLIMKGFLEKLPGEIIESAKIDGASELRIIGYIVLPLSKPALATVGLFIAFLYWNDWWLGLLFVDNPNLVPLQLLLYRTMNTIEFLSNNMTNMDMGLNEFPSQSARMALAVLAVGPMMVIFPFFQRFFIKGLTVGSLKG